MKCPLCDNTMLCEVELEAGLIANECGTCGGHWLSSTHYWNWLEKHGDVLPEKTVPDVDIDVADSSKAKICPDCSHILIKYKVGHGTRYYLDHCNSCNGVWLDKDEWEDLKARNLHDEIQDIFTSGWQERVRSDERNERIANGYKKLFGETDYQELRRIRAWIDRHPKKENILSYLMNPDPEAL